MDQAPNTKLSIHFFYPSISNMVHVTIQVQHIHLVVVTVPVAFSTLSTTTSNLGAGLTQAQDISWGFNVVPRTLHCNE